VELIGPSVNDGVPVEENHGGHEAVFEFLLGRDADVAQDLRPSLEKQPSTRVLLLAAGGAIPMLENMAAIGLRRLVWLGIHRCTTVL
jgi:hypothetical protein